MKHINWHFEALRGDILNCSEIQWLDNIMLADKHKRGRGHGRIPSLPINTPLQCHDEQSKRNEVVWRGQRFWGYSRWNGM